MLISPDTLLYVTGGVAFADVSHRLSVPSVGFSQTDSDWTTGWTIGGGVEFLRHGNWLLRAEALYVDLGSDTHSYTITLPPPCGGVCTDTVKYDDAFWVARVGLSYKFGVEERHRPLK
jgi:outer membrane immunogenic protein